MGSRMDDDRPRRNEVVVKAEGVSKKFCYSLQRGMRYGVSDIMRTFFLLPRHSDRLREEEFWAVDDVSLEIRKGESVGLLGMNGSGKTTLFRLLTGIFEPDRGQVMTRGRVGALISVGAGFHPHLTGRENIYLNGALLGMTRKDINLRLDDIVDFADIGKFLDSPVATYSSGMRVRLGFAIATAVDADVLLVDEILAVGDASFQRRCYERMEKILGEAAVILVSHNTLHIEELCGRAVFLHKGRVQMDGPTHDVLHRYIEFTNRESAQYQLDHASERAGSGEIRFMPGVRVTGGRSGPGRITTDGEDVIIEAHFKCHSPLKNVRFVVALQDVTFGAILTSAESSPVEIRDDGVIHCTFKDLKLTPNAYTVSVGITDLRMPIDVWRHATELVVASDGRAPSNRQSLIETDTVLEVITGPEFSEAGSLNHNVLAGIST